ncbi:MAG: hypothetical protein KDC54_23720 [Lewinella sp.]|nr:hypothetical protein [Lewinella sp.]
MIPFHTTLLYGILIALSACSGQVGLRADKASPGQDVSALPDTIRIIYQDQRGHYWFGSNGQGVFRYDGHTLRQFTTAEGLASDQVRGIQEDVAGNLYFDTPVGVTVFDGRNLQALQPVESASAEWRLAPGDLWFNGNGDRNGVFRYDGERLVRLLFPAYDLEAAFGQPFAERPYSPYGAYSHYRDRAGNLWFGTLSAGVFRYDGSPLWISEPELSVLEDGRVPGVRSIIEDKDGNFWLGNILHRYRLLPAGTNGAPAYEKLPGIERVAGREYPDFPYYLAAVTDAATGDLWMVTYSEGVWRYDGEELVHYPVKDGERTVLLTTIFQDRQGVLWLGTLQDGVYRQEGEGFARVAW